MPNWCENELKVKGTQKQLAEFKKKYFNTRQEDGKTITFLDFDLVIPQPKSIEECPKEYIIHNAKEAQKQGLGYEKNDPMKWFNWYEWRYEFWGTKWGIDECGIEDYDDELVILFDTAWAPPTPVIQTLIKDNPQLEISCEYIEPGMMFGGFINDEGDYQYSEDELRTIYSDYFCDDEDEEEYEEDDDD